MKYMSPSPIKLGPFTLIKVPKGFNLYIFRYCILGACQNKLFICFKRSNEFFEFLEDYYG